jgi:hypothetical protein
LREMPTFMTKHGLQFIPSIKLMMSLLFVKMTKSATEVILLAHTRRDVSLRNDNKGLLSQFYADGKFNPMST